MAVLPSAQADTTAPALDPSRPYRLHPQAALRPERFGALAYHYGTRRLSLLKAPALADLVRGLHQHPSADAALDAAAETPAARSSLASALDRLARTGFVIPLEQETP